MIIRSLDDSSPWPVNFHRSIGLLGAVTVILLLRYRGQALAVIRGIGRFGFVGGVLLAAAGITFVQALNNTTVANAMFVLGAIPFFTAFFARALLGEKLRRITLATMMVALVGLAVMVFEGLRLGSGYGNLMAILTAVAFALYAVIVRRKRQQEMLPTLLVSSVTITLVAVIASGGDVEASPHDMLLCFIWGGLLSGVANYLFIYASRHLAAAEVTLFMLLEFALAPLWVWAIVNEVPGGWTVVGGVLIISAVALRALVELARRQKPPQTISGPV